MSFAMRRPRRAAAILAFAAVALIGLAALPIDAGAHAGQHPAMTDATAPAASLDPFTAEFEIALDEADREFDAIVLAHAAQLSPRDQCHKSKAEGRRHWHKPDTAEPGGACIKRDGTTYRVLEVEAPAAEVEAPWQVCAAEWFALHDKLGAWGGVSARAGALMDCLRGAYRPRE